VTDPDDKAHALQIERRLAEQMCATAERLRHVANDAIATVERLNTENAALLEKNVKLVALAQAYRSLRAVERDLLRAQARWDRVYYREEEPIVQAEATEAVRFLQERKQEIEAQLKELEAI